MMISSSSCVVLSSLFLQINSGSSTQFLCPVQNCSTWGHRVSKSHFELTLNSTIVKAILVLVSPQILINLTHVAVVLTFLYCFGFWLSWICRCSSQILGYAGISYSNPTLSSAISNLIPAFTFILAVICRFLSLC